MGEVPIPRFQPRPESAHSYTCEIRAPGTSAHILCKLFLQEKGYKALAHTAVTKHPEILALVK